MHLDRYKSGRYKGFIDPRFDGEGLRRLLVDPEAVGDIDGAELVPTRPGRVVHRLNVETPRGDCLVYTHLLCNRCGLFTARVIAAIWPRWLPLNRTSFAVTLAIPDAVPLSSLKPDEFHGRVGGFGKTQLVRQIARQTAWMHAHGFFHKDLIAQNILVARRRSTPMIWFVGLGRAGSVRWMPPPVRPFRWAADIKALMRSEVAAFNDRDRAVFLETYLRAMGKTPGSQLVRRILAREARR
jgi:hypothetical protein